MMNFGRVLHALFYPQSMFNKLLGNRGEKSGSALSTIVLREWLSKFQRRQAEGSLIPSRFQKNLAKSHSLHWTIATSKDSRFPTMIERSKPSKLGGLLH